MELEKRSIKTNIRAAEEELKIGGYFILFNDETELYPGIYERVSSDSLNDSLENDIRCLFNHQTETVLGRTTANTLTLEKDEKGLYGEVTINPNDTEAMNVYERVKRGDIDQCSFGFNILDEATELDEHDNLHITLKKVDLHEVSIVTFPAYPNTSVSARSKQRDEMKNKRIEMKRERLVRKLKGES